MVYMEREARIAVVTDITDRKLVELELERYRKHLESMVEERTAELEVAKERAESADQRKVCIFGHHVARTSHTIKLDHWFYRNVASGITRAIERRAKKNNYE